MRPVDSEPPAVDAAAFVAAAGFAVVVVTFGAAVVVVTFVELAAVVVVLAGVVVEVVVEVVADAEALFLLEFFFAAVGLDDPHAAVIRPTARRTPVTFTSRAT